MTTRKFSGIVRIKIDYLIKVNNFKNIAEDTLDEWIYFLKNEEIKIDFATNFWKDGSRFFYARILNQGDKTYEGCGSTGKPEQCCH
ncbi:hypothetical protein QUF76_13200 [Desulfobacterales bacterium HSG16]|nr:hypothetical protein [Desulfobacterales bacterium HSG16]